MSTAIMFCAACKENVQFDSEGTAEYCSQCGRTPQAALTAVKADAWLRRSKIAKWIWYGAGLPLLIGLGMAFVPGATLGAIGQVLGLVIIGGPILGIMALYRRWRRRP